MNLIDKSMCRHQSAVIVERFQAEPGRLVKKPHHLFCYTCGATIPLAPAQEDRV